MPMDGVPFTLKNLWGSGSAPPICSPQPTILNKESSERGSGADSHELDLSTPTHVCTNVYSVIKCKAHLFQPDPLIAFLKAGDVGSCGVVWVWNWIQNEFDVTLWRRLWVLSSVKWVWPNSLPLSVSGWMSATSVCPCCSPFNFC